MPPERPLKGRTIVVTRPRGGRADTAALLLKKAGARVVSAPLIRIAPPRSASVLDRTLRRLTAYDAVVFASRNAVERFFGRARTLRLSPLPKPREVYAVGPETARALRARGWGAAKVPKVHRAEALARMILPAKGKSVLIPRGSRGRDILPEALKAAGAKVTVAQAYRTEPDRRGLNLLIKEARNGLDAVCFASGSAVETLAQGLGAKAFRRLFAKAAAASIGPVTAEALKSFGVKAAVQAKDATSRSLFQALNAYFMRKEVSFPRKRESRIHNLGPRLRSAGTTR